MIGGKAIPGVSAAESEPAAAPMPDALKQIQAQARLFQAGSRERAQTAQEWRGQVERLRQGAPSARVEDDGETVRLGDLSPGCAACKAGRWDCLFVTMRCNLSCPFCLTPRGLVLRPMRSALGDDLHMLCARYARVGIEGVSFSGGEPFLDPDPVLEWLSVLRRELPGLYIWAYTNGLTLSPTLLERLGDAGLNEIRFNLAASGYHHPLAARMLREAVGRIPAVAVEVPAIPEQAGLILDSLRRWADAGVKYLNLHELIYESGSNSEGMGGARVACVMPDGHRCSVNPGSSELVRTVLRRVATDNLPLAVNDCSLRNKARQMRGRRRLLAPFVLQPHERLREDGLAESICLFSADRVEFVHPASLDEPRRLRTGWQQARLRRQLPLDIEHHGEWVYFELMAGN